MPTNTARHEAPVALFQADPMLAVWLLRQVFGYPLRHVVRAEVTNSEVAILLPVPRPPGGPHPRPKPRARVYQADLIIRLYDGSGTVVLAVVIEIQRGRDYGKRHAWARYITYTESVEGVDVPLIVIVFDESGAAFVRRQANEPGPHGVQVRPLVCFRETVRDAATRDLGAPASAPVLAALLAEGNLEPGEAPAVRDALAALATATNIPYIEIIQAALPDELRLTQEEADRVMLHLDLANPRPEHYRSPVARLIAARHQELGHAEGQAEGQALGMVRGQAQSLAETIVRILEMRAIPVDALAHATIVATTDLDTLRRWRDRALTEQTVDAVLTTGDAIAA